MMRGGEGGQGKGVPTRKVAGTGRPASVRTAWAKDLPEYGRRGRGEREQRDEEGDKSDVGGLGRPELPPSLTPHTPHL